MDDKRYLLSLIREGEHQQQDFKYRVADACKLAKSISAFANTDATVPPSAKRPVYARDEEGLMRAYIRIKDENILASPVHLALWQESQKFRGSVITYDDSVRQLLSIMKGSQTLNQIVRLSKLPRHKVIMLLARLIRFGTVRWEHIGQQFHFSLS